MEDVLTIGAIMQAITVVAQLITFILLIGIYKNLKKINK